MNAQDLMIGNCIKWKDNGSIFEITIDVFCDKNFQNHLASGDFEPIILSEDILVRVELNDWIIYNRFECRYNNNSVSVYAWRNGKSIFIIDLFFLHDLQNWYRLHSKQDLQITL